MSLTWFIAFVAFSIVGGVTTSLTSIWFIGGFLAVPVIQAGGDGLYPQLAVFVATSFMLFLMIRPFTYKYLYSKRTNINVDSLTGHKAAVEERIDSVTGVGSAILVGETWLARAAQKGDIFKAGDIVIISAVSGAKLLVAVTEQEHEVEKV